MNKKSSQSLYKLIPILIFTVIGVFCGVLMSKYIDIVFSGGASLFKYFLVLFIFILLIYFSIIIQSIIHELGHLIFGLFTGYKFSSFRIGSIMLVKQNGKYKIKRFSILGTAGQCLMLPPNLVNGTMPYMLYNLGGSILNLITVPLFCCLYFVFRDISAVPVVFLIFAAIGAAVGLLNIIPLRFSEVDNDGYNCVSLYKSAEAVKSFYIQTKATNELLNGKAFMNMPKEWFYLPDDEAIQNPLTAVIGVLYVKRLLEEHSFDKAEIIIDKLISEKSTLSAYHKKMLICDKIFCLLLKKDRVEEAKAFLTPVQINFINQIKSTPSAIRCKFAIEKILNNDIKACEKLLERFKKLEKNYPFTNEIKTEKGLIELIDNLKI